MIAINSGMWLKHGVRLAVCLLPGPFILGIEQCQCSDCDNDGWSESDGDCDDQDANTYPGAPEMCDGMDNNCNGQSDEGLGSSPVEVYDDLGDSNTYSSGGDWIGNLSGWVVAAAQFTPNSSGEIEAIDLALFWANQGSNTFTLKVLDDNGGYPGNTELWSETFNNELGAYGSIASLSNLGGPAVIAGTPYWLYVEAPYDGASVVYWYNNNQSMNGCKALRDASTNSNWSLYCQYEQRGMRITLGGCN